MIHKTSDIYGINRELPLNYVARNNVDNLFVGSLTRDKHIVIYGSSKQGKTSLRKHCLQESDYIVIHCSNRWSLSDLHTAILKRAGYEITQSTARTTSGRNKILAVLKFGIPGFGSDVSMEDERSSAETVTKSHLELDSEDVNEIISALNNFRRYIVLEDFHYLTVETQKDFAVALKAFHEQSKLCFIIVGVWLEEGRLTVYNGDLTGRVIGINADKWQRDELEEVISAGEAMLNIDFSPKFKKAVLDGCVEAVYILQEACYQACIKSNIFQTQLSFSEIGSDINVDDLIREVVNQQTGRYNSFITQFTAGFQDTTLQMYKWLLFPVIIASRDQLEEGLSYRTMRELLREHHPEGKGLNLGNLTQALKSVASLQVKKDIKPIVLDYDETNLRLNVVDRAFLIWIVNQDRNELLELAELPNFVVPKIGSEIGSTI